jgi:hypothetical protein
MPTFDPSFLTDEARDLTRLSAALARQRVAPGVRLAEMMARLQRETVGGAPADAAPAGDVGAFPARR